jgi:myosin heavy subunit
VLDSDAFAGEGVIELLHPGERRLISYAADLAVRISADAESADPVLRKVSAQKGVMFVTEEERETVTYKVSNFDTSPRQVIIEHPARDGWELTGDIKPEEATASVHRFRVKVEPKRTAKLVVTQRRPVSERFELSGLDEDDAKLLLEKTKLSPETLQVLRRIMAQHRSKEELDNQMKSRQHELDSIAGDQTRVRENMKSLKGSAEEKALLQRYVRQLDAQEDRITALRTELAGLRQQREAAQAELDKTLAELTLDVAL